MNLNKYFIVIISMILPIEIMKLIFLYLDYKDQYTFFKLGLIHRNDLCLPFKKQTTIPLVFVDEFESYVRLNGKLLVKMYYSFNNGIFYMIEQNNETIFFSIEDTYQNMYKDEYIDFCNYP